MKTTLCTLIVAASLMFATNGYAQSDTLQMDVTFTGTMEIVLKNSGKISSWPQIRESVVELPPIKYSLMPFKPLVSIEPKTIDAAKINIEPRLSKLYRGYVRGGFGLYTTALLDVYYMDERSRNGSWGVEYKHLSSAGNVALEDSIPDNFSHNMAHLWGRRLLKKHALHGDLRWDRNMVHAYGIDPQLFFDANTDDLRHVFNGLTGSVGLESFYRDSSQLNYRGDIRFRNYTDLVGSVENNVDFRGHARKFVENDLYRVDVGINYNDYSFESLTSGETENRDNVLINVEPKVTTRKGPLEINVGAGIWLDARGSSPFHFYPIAEAAVHLIDDLFVPYGGLTGRMQLNNYHELTSQNPFALSELELRNTNRKLEVYGGIRGSISAAAGFNVRVSNIRYDDFLYFVNDTLNGPGNRFSTLYDELNVFNLRAEFTIKTLDNFRLQARGDYYLYATGSELHAWYQPTTRMTLSAGYNIDDKLLIGLDVFTEGQRRAKSLTQVRDDDAVLEDDGTYTVNLNAYLDANLNIEYRYTKRLSGWLRFNNFLASRYAFWNLYPVQRFNAMMGASYSF
jgi:hypothetical protein